MMRRSPLIKLLVLGAILGATALACQLIVGVKDDPGSKRLDSAPVSVLPDSSPDAAPSDRCAHSLPPPPPGTTDLADVAPFWLAFRTFVGIKRDDAGAVVPIGYDLDGVCTGFEGPTVRDGGASCASNREFPDQEGGVDNVFSETLRSLPSNAGDKALAGFSEDIDRGLRTVLLYVEGYNGTPNDPEIKGRFVPVETTRTSLCDGGREVNLPDADHPAPRWEGCDTWDYEGTLIKKSADGAAAPVEALIFGYVANGVLVLDLRKIKKIDFRFGGLALSAADAIVTGRLSKTTVGGKPGYVMTDGVIAGRVEMTDVIKTARQFIYDGKSLCHNEVAFTLVKGFFCGARDIAETTGQDFVEGKRCTSMSLGLGFTAEQAGVGMEAGASLVAACDAGREDCPP